MRMHRRQSRLIGDNDGISQSGFDSIFAALREEEEDAIAAAENEGMEAFLREVDREFHAGNADGCKPQRGTQTGSIRSASGRNGRHTPRGNKELSAPAPAAPPSWALPLYSAHDRNTDSGADGSRSSSLPRAARTTPQPILSDRAAMERGGARRMDPAPEGISVGQLVTVIPTKVMVFIDGTWLYYQLYGRQKHSSVAKQYGEDWRDHYHFDFSALPQLISDHVSAELMRTQPHAQRAVEVVRVLVFSSFRPDEAELISERQRMFRAMQELHFEVHLGDFTGGQEKCVDIALAVDMLHYATVPNAFDIAVLVSGDRDFIPALVRTRQKGKRVCICSMRASASKDYENPTANVKDFSVLWLDDHLDELIGPIHPSLLNERPAMARFLCSVVEDFLMDADEGASSTARLEGHLAQVALGAVSAADYLEHEFGGLLPFLELFSAKFDIGLPEGVGLPSEGNRGEYVIRSTSYMASKEDERIESNLESAAAAAVAAVSTHASSCIVEETSPLSNATMLETSKQSPQDVTLSTPDEGAALKQNSNASIAGRSDGALLVDGSLLELLEQELERYEAEQNPREKSFPTSKALPAGHKASLVGDVSRDAAPAASHRNQKRGKTSSEGNMVPAVKGITTMSRNELARLTVPQLKAELRARQLPVMGAKHALVRRLASAVTSEQQPADTSCAPTEF